MNDKLKESFILSVIEQIPRDDFEKTYFIIEKCIAHLMNVLAIKTSFEESLARNDENLNKLSLGDHQFTGIEFGIKIITQPREEEGSNVSAIRIDLFYMPDMKLTDDLLINDFGCSPTGKY